MWIAAIKMPHPAVDPRATGSWGSVTDVALAALTQSGVQPWWVMLRELGPAADLGGGALRSRQLPLPDCIGQVGHPLRRLRADRLQGHAARVHALEQADSGAEQHG
jgi:hypothetical protein